MHVEVHGAAAPRGAPLQGIPGRHTALVQTCIHTYMHTYMNGEVTSSSDPRASLPRLPATSSCESAPCRTRGPDTRGMR